MATTPSAALSIRPPENPLDQYAKALSVKNMMSQGTTQQLEQTGMEQQNQQRALAINDQKATTAAMQEWDGKSYDDLLPLVVKHGGSSNAVLGLKKTILDQQEKKSKIAADDATTGSKNLDMMKTKNDMLLGHLNAATDVPDSQLIDAVHREKNAALANGYLDPQHGEMLEQLLSTGDPQKVRGALLIFEKGLRSEKEQFSQAKDNAETYKNIQQGNLAKAEALQKGSPLTAMENDPNHFTAEKLPATMAYLQSKVAEPNADPVDKARATRLLSTAQTAQKLMFRQDASKKATEQAVTQGSPTVAAQLLVDGDSTLAQLKSRGVTPEFIAQTLNEAKRISGGKFNAQQAEAQFDVAKSPTNVAFFGSAKSLTNKGGTLDQLADAAKDIPSGQIPVFNTVADALKASTGSGPIAKYASILLGVADDYSKVMGGGQGSDTSRTQALKLVPANASPEARAAALEGIRGSVNSQLESRIGSNPVLKKMYGSDSGAAPAAKTLSLAQIQQAAKDHNVSVDEATRQAKAAGYEVKP